MDVGKGKLLSAVSTFMSCIALAGLLVVLVQNQQMQGDVKRASTQKTLWTPDSAQQERALREVRIDIQPLVYVYIV